MSSAAKQLIPYSQFETLRAGREIIQQEAEALLALKRRLDAGFCKAVDLLLNCSGSIIVCGMGKAGLIGQKITATLSSTGTRAHFLHPAEAVHGDLGCLHANDVFLALSNSGETQELISILPAIKEFGIATIALTASDRSTLGSQVDAIVELGRMREAGTIGLAPTTSTAAMLAAGDALALVVSQSRGFTPEHFARFHPGGSLGKRLKRVTEIMRPRDQLRIAPESATVREVITQSARPGRRTGAVLLIDETGSLTGIFTDSDLARMLENRRDHDLDSPICQWMTRQPLAVSHSALFAEVVDVLSERKISELPVVDEQRRPVGLIDITDMIGWLPHEGGLQ